MMNEKDASAAMKSAAGNNQKSDMVGKTSSGKAVYDTTAGNAMYSNFSKQDHADASAIHKKMSAKLMQMGNKDMAAKHDQYSASHNKMTNA